MPESTIPPARSAPPAFPLSTVFFALLAAHRCTVAQDRIAQRVMGLAIGWLLTLGRHTITRVLAALGLVEVDWTAFYRLFSHDRIDCDELSGRLLRQTLDLAPADRPYLVTVDGTTIRRPSRTMPGTGWLRAPGTAPWRRGLARCQRFVDLCWLPAPSPEGYSRAVPRRWAPAFTPKAVPAAGYPPRKEWEAGVAEVQWVRTALDAAGRPDQRVLVVADGHYATAPVWQALPAEVLLLARCAKNRALFCLPEPPAPGQRGRTVRPTDRVEGPSRLKGAADHPVFLLVVKGVARRGRRLRREPPSWLVSAEPTAEGGWALPVPAETLLAWA